MLLGPQYYGSALFEWKLLVKIDPQGVRNICIDFHKQTYNKLAAKAANSFKTNARRYFDARL